MEVSLTDLIIAVAGLLGGGGVFSFVSSRYGRVSELEKRINEIVDERYSDTRKLAEMQGRIVKLQRYILVLHQLLWQAGVEVPDPPEELDMGDFIDELGPHEHEEKDKKDG